jgi:ubiquinone/menaquinone biosynthesis C-methylase UbiE
MGVISRPVTSIMELNEKKEIIKRYTDRFDRLGGVVEALGSGSDEHQAIRYKVLSEIADLGGQRVLDVGCGFGGFVDYCRHYGQPVTYTGIDIVPAFLEEASKRHPEEEFLEMDILDAPDDLEYDYVVSSQAFNNRFGESDNLNVIKKVISKCFRIAKKGVAFDMMSSHVDFREDHLYYFDPAEVFSFCKTLTKRVSLRHDYPLFEFCVYLYPDFTGWRKEN